jgi:hypothetical protein
VAGIGQLSRTLEPVGAASGRAQVRQIYQTLVEILQVIGSDSKKRAYAEPFLNDYLVPIQAVLVPYVRLVTRKVELGTGDLAETEKSTLPRIQSEIDKLKSDLYRSDLTQLRTGKELVDLMSLPIVVSRKDDDR